MTPTSPEEVGFGTGSPPRTTDFETTVDRLVTALGATRGQCQILGDASLKGRDVLVGCTRQPVLLKAAWPPLPWRLCGSV
jgi:hypothetical protein